jgi:hypothetical protein
MRRAYALTLALVLVASSGAAMLGCENDDGPVEKAGEAVDEAVEDLDD